MQAPLRWARLVLHYIYYPDLILAPIIDFFAENPIRWGTRIMGISIIGGGLLFSFVEKDASIPDGMWWAFISAMTVGYGDFSPEDLLMRSVTVGVVFGGALFLIGLGSAVNARTVAKRLGKAGETPELYDDVEVIAALYRQAIDTLGGHTDSLEALAITLKERETTRQEGSAQ